jgi:hypothetical protein
MTNTTMTRAEGEADDFEWNSKNEDVLVPMAPALALYLTDWNQIVLRKYVEAGDVIVEINKHDVPEFTAQGVEVGIGPAVVVELRRRAAGPLESAACRSSPTKSWPKHPHRIIYIVAAS